jgi:hypothetical protein
MSDDVKKCCATCKWISYDEHGKGWCDGYEVLTPHCDSCNGYETINKEEGDGRT